MPFYLVETYSGSEGYTYVYCDARNIFSLNQNQINWYVNFRYDASISWPFYTQLNRNNITYTYIIYE